MEIINLLPLACAMILSPLMGGIINRTKAIFVGRHGQPIIQPYFDLYKLFNKGAVFSKTTTWVFRGGPIGGCASLLVAAAIMPFCGVGGIISFQGDLILFAYLLGIARFLTVIAALDTGSAFEGMGAGREVQFATLSEPALFLAIGAVAIATKSITLSEMFSSLSFTLLGSMGAIAALVAFALMVVFLCENCRIPVDDPNTHLELTMIHEVMVLDHSGPDFGYILYQANLKMWVLGALLIGIVLPVHSSSFIIDLALSLAGMFVLCVVVGIIESSMARLRLLKVPLLLMGAIILSVVALIFSIRVV
jgi:formate hydrogenlyase subunit 4